MTEMQIACEEILRFLDGSLRPNTDSYEEFDYTAFFEPIFEDMTNAMGLGGVRFESELATLQKQVVANVTSVTRLRKHRDIVKDGVEIMRRCLVDGSADSDDVDIECWVSLMRFNVFSCSCTAIGGATIGPLSTYGRRVHQVQDRRRSERVPVILPKHIQAEQRSGSSLQGDT